MIVSSNLLGVIFWFFMLKLLIEQEEMGKECTGDGFTQKEKDKRKFTYVLCVLILKIIFTIIMIDITHI